jgi:hypothetical protein
VNDSFDGTTDWAVVAAEVRGATTAAGPVTLSVTTSGNGTVTLNPPGGSYASGTNVTLSAAPAAGSTFTGWSGAVTGSANPATLLVNANKSVIATFVALPPTITVLPSTGGSIALSPSGGGPYPLGTQVAVTATPAAGYRFDSWGGSLSGTTNPATVLMDGPKTISATFIRRYALTTSKTGSGSVVASPSGGVYDAGTVVTLTAVPSNPVASFLGWGGALSGTTNPRTIVMNSDTTVSASFTQTYTLTVTIRRSGSVTLTPPGGIYLAGTTVTLRAIPGSGYVFGGWSGALSGSSNPKTLLMNGNKSVTATFRRP